MKRGEIYYIKRSDCFSSIGESSKPRPGVIVSNDALNNTTDVVMVVYLTTHPQQALPTHVCIHATGTPSTVICERIDYVPAQLIGDLCGTCTEKELAAIERGMLKALDLVVTEPMEAEVELSDGEKWLMQEVAKLQEERDRYAKMLDHLLGGGKA